MLDSLFHLTQNKTTVRTELLAGTTTFLTMAYIIFVQPAVLSGAMFGKPTGMDIGAVTTATCLSAALASAIMGLYAKYPIAQAPGMGQNFFFVFSAIPAAAAAGFANSWEVALGVVFLSGVLFLGFSCFGVREAVMDAISPSLKNGIAVGIGLFIALIGLQNAGLVVKDPGTGVKLSSHFASPDLLVFFFGLLLAAGLHARKVRGSLLWAIGATTIVAVALKLTIPSLGTLAAAPTFAESKLMKQFAITHGLFSAPPSLAPTFLQMDVASALKPAMWPFILVFLFMVLFDTVGTLVGIGEQGGFIKDNKLPRAREAFVSDALGTTLGACLGTSTVTSYIESAAGVEQGGRTGLTALTVSGFFLLALFFSPLIAMVGSYPPITAPALVLVGAMMFRSVTHITWDDYTECVPAFLVMVGIPFGYSIGDGLALGFIAYPVVKFLAGRWHEVKRPVVVVAALMLAYFLLVRGNVG